MFWTKLCFLIVALMLSARIGGVFLGMIGASAFFRYDEYRRNLFYK